MPPERSDQPKVKRSCAWMPSWPISVTNRPSTPISQPFSGVAARDRAGHHHAEQGEPEELEGAELERRLPQRRREQRKAHHAEQRAEHRPGGGDAHGAAGLPLLRERVAVEAGRGVGGGARDVEQDRGAAAAVDRADVGADQDQDRVVRRHLHRQRGEQRDAQRRRQPRHAAHQDADQRRAQRIEQGPEREEAGEGAAQGGEAFHGSGQAHEEHVLEQQGDDAGGERRD